MSEWVDIKNLLICGCGNGMHALLPVAIENSGCRVNVYTPFADEAERFNEAVRHTGGIRICGCSQSPRYKPFLATADAERAARDTDMVLMVLPAFAHGDVLKQLAPYLREGIIVGAMPARSGLEFQACRILADANLSEFTVFGLQTLPWACRLKAFGSEVEVLGTKQSVGVSAVPAKAVEPLSDFMTRLLNVPMNPMNSMIALSLSNMGQIIHRENQHFGKSPGLCFMLICILFDRPDYFSGAVRRRDFYFYFRCAELPFIFELVEPLQTGLPVDFTDQFPLFQESALDMNV